MTYRFVFEKRGSAAYISHLELARVVERSFRRAAITVEYSEGFNPHMRLSFGPALSLGCESLCEMIDVNMPKLRDETAALASVNKFTPAGIRFLAVAPLGERHKSISAQYPYARFLVSLPANTPYEQLTRFHAEASIIFEKISPKGRKLIDVKAVIAVQPELLKPALDGEENVLEFTLNLGNASGTIRPADLVTVIFGKIISDNSHYCRTQLLESL